MKGFLYEFTTDIPYTEIRTRKEQGIPQNQFRKHPNTDSNEQKSLKLM
jgi:hypothetical protein